MLGENKDIAFYRIDVDNAENIANDYEIMYLPTLVIFESGEEINRSIGQIDESQLIEFINN